MDIERLMGVPPDMKLLRSLPKLTAWCSWDRPHGVSM